MSVFTGPWGGRPRHLLPRGSLRQWGTREPVALSNLAPAGFAAAPFDDEDRQRMRTVDSTFSEGDDRSN